MCYVCADRYLFTYLTNTLKLEIAQQPQYVYNKSIVDHLKKMKKEVTVEYLLYLGGCKRLEDIKSLDLSSHDLTAVDVDLFNKLKGLKSLDLSQNQLTYIPDDLKLPVLTVLDCTQNCLQSVSFAQNFRKLKELYFDENKQLSFDDECIVKMLCPHIHTINDYEDSKPLDTAIALYSNQLKPQLEAVWEAKFGEVYENGVPAEELDSLHEEFIETVRKSGIVGTHLTMVKFKEFMIEHLSKELILNVNTRTYRSSQGTPGRSQRKSDSGRYGTRVSSGVSSLKDYSSGTPMEVVEDTNQGQITPTRSQGHRIPNKAQSHMTPTRTSKRKRDSEGGEKGTPVKVRKVEDANTTSKTPSTPRFTILKQKCEQQEGYHLPNVDDYDPEIFLRCHSKGNNPADDNTKVWTCAFEPRTDTEGETTNIVATCGGKLVCLIDCQTGKVLRRYKDNSKSESFYTLAWTTLEADNKNLKEDVNILAVAGHDGQIKLIHPRQLLMFAVIEGHRCYISSLVFHPEEKNILFSASRDSRIIMWRIGTPDFKTNKIDYSQIAVLSLPNTDAIGLVVSPDLDILVAGCEKSCYAWDIKKLSNNQKNIVPHYEFVHPQEEDDDSSDTVDGLALLSNNCLVSKCVGHSCLYLWDLKQHAVKRNSGKTKAVQMQPLALLEYTPVTVDYIYLSTVKDLVCVGDDKGNVYMYDVKTIVKQKKKKSDEILWPSRVIEYPDRNVDNRFLTSMMDVSDKEDVVINCVALDSNKEFMVYGTDNNIVALWRNAAKL